MPWRKVITKSLLERQINTAVDSFADAICESLEHLTDNIHRTYLSLNESERSGPAGQSLKAALNYIEELMKVVRCK